MPTQSGYANIERDMRQVPQGRNSPGQYGNPQQQQRPGPPRAHSPIAQRPQNAPMPSQNRSSPTKPVYGQQGGHQQSPVRQNFPNPNQPSPVRKGPYQADPRQQRPPQQQPTYHNPPQQQRTQQYPPPRPQLQVSVTAPKDPFVDPPRAAFITPPSASFSSDNLPNNLSTKNLLQSPSSPSVSNVSLSNPDNDRLAPARIVGEGQDFWKRFSMVAHEAEMEKTRPNTGKDPWLSKEFRGTKKFKLGVWAIGLICIAAIGGSLAWHFTHNSGAKLTTPTQHDFGLGGTSSVVRTGVAAGVGGGDNTVLLPGASTAALADPDQNIAAVQTDEATAILEIAPTTSAAVRTTASSTRRFAVAPVESTTALASSTSTTRARATSTSTSVPARPTVDRRRMHRHKRAIR